MRELRSGLQQIDLLLGTDLLGRWDDGPALPLSVRRDAVQCQSQVDQRDHHITDDWLTPTRELCIVS